MARWIRYVGVAAVLVALGWAAWSFLRGPTLMVPWVRLVDGKPATVRGRPDGAGKSAGRRGTVGDKIRYVEAVDSYQSEGKARADTLRTHARANPEPIESVPLDARQREKLRALGYLE